MRRVVDTPGLACPVCAEPAPAVELVITEPDEVRLGPGMTATPTSEVEARTAIPCGHALASLDCTIGDEGPSYRATPEVPGPPG